MKIIVSAGGTGGHIYPALAIINKIKEKEPNAEFLYIGTHNRMEKDIVPKYNIPFKQIEIYGLNKKHIIKTGLCLIKSLKKAKKIIQEFKPDIVIGVGGYVTVPVVYEAHKLGIKTMIHEQNSIAGKANKFLGNCVDVVATSFSSSNKYFEEKKVLFTGNPCSENAKKIKPANKKDLGLSENKKLLLIVTGSLGARTINEYIINNINHFKNQKYEVLFITGETFYENIKNKEFPKNIKVLPFYENLSSIMKKTDLMITRAGASTLSEVIALEIPSIIIPSPYVPNNHQYINAKDLTDKKAAKLVEEKDLNNLINVVDEVMGNEKLQEEMKNNLKHMQINNSSTLIYNKIKELTCKK